jgi:hypothetical protein
MDLPGPPPKTFHLNKLEPLLLIFPDVKTRDPFQSVNYSTKIKAKHMLGRDKKRKENKITRII